MINLPPPRKEQLIPQPLLLPDREHFLIRFADDEFIHTSTITNISFVTQEDNELVAFIESTIYTIRITIEDKDDVVRLLHWAHSHTSLSLLDTKLPQDHYA